LIDGIVGQVTDLDFLDRVTAKDRCHLGIMPRLDVRACRDGVDEMRFSGEVSTKARLALALLLYTAQRRSDVVRMGRQHVGNGMISVRQQKTGATLTIPVHPDLAAIIEATPSEHLTFLTTSFGKPFTAPGFGNWFREQCDEALIPKHCAAHGLRKAACRRLAEAGCNANVIASMSGHTTLTEVARYTKAADQERMDRDGMAAIKSRSDSCNGPQRIAKSGEKA
jgi:integrase